MNAKTDWEQIARSAVSYIVDGGCMECPFFEEHSKLCGESIHSIQCRDNIIKALETYEEN